MTDNYNELPMDNVEAIHAHMVQRLNKSGEEILASLTPEKCELWHHLTGVMGEIGEIVDAVKKHLIYETPLDMKNLEEEFGDLEFYLREMYRLTGVSRKAAMINNMRKLAKRYPGYMYSNTRAATRADKQESVETAEAAAPAPHAQILKEADANVLHAHTVDPRGDHPTLNVNELRVLPSMLLGDHDMARLRMEDENND